MIVEKDNFEDRLNQLKARFENRPTLTDEEKEHGELKSAAADNVPYWYRIQSFMLGDYD